MSTGDKNINDIIGVHLDQILDTIQFKNVKIELKRAARRPKQWKFQAFEASPEQWTNFESKNPNPKFWVGPIPVPALTIRHGQSIDLDLRCPQLVF